MMLVIVICHAAALCDRITAPVDNCIMSAMKAEVILAQAHLLQDGDHVIITCGKSS